LFKVTKLAAEEFSNFLFNDKRFLIGLPLKYKGFIRSTERVRYINAIRFIKDLECESTIVMENYLTNVKNNVLDFLGGFTPTLIKAIITLIIGVIVLRIVKKIIDNFLTRSKQIDDSIKSFLRSLISIVLYFGLVAIVATVLGVEASSFIALLGAAGLAVGFALQGSLANFAGGILLITFKPLRINDWVEIKGQFGVVHQIDILYTRLKTFDGRILSFPNGIVANTHIDNWTMTEVRRINLHFQIPLEEDVDRVREIMLKVMNDHPLVLEDPAPSVWLDSIDAYALNIYARSFCKNKDYYPTIWNHLENIKKALDNNDIKVQVPKKEVVYSSLDDKKQSKPND